MVFLFINSTRDHDPKQDILLSEFTAKEDIDGQSSRTVPIPNVKLLVKKIRENNLTFHQSRYIYGCEVTDEQGMVMCLSLQIDFNFPQQEGKFNLSIIQDSARGIVIRVSYPRRAARKPQVKVSGILHHYD